MLRLPLTLGIASLLLVAACEKAEPPATRAPIDVRSEGMNRLFKMSELDRSIGLKRSIFASGSRCSRVTETHFVGAYRNMDMWAVRCDDDREWAVFIAPDDSVQVRLCADTEKVGLPSCATKGAPPAAAR